MTLTPRATWVMGAKFCTKTATVVPMSTGAAPSSEAGVRLAQKMQAGPRIPQGIQLEKAEVGPTSGPTRRLSHFGHLVVGVAEGEDAEDLARVGSILSLWHALE